MAVTEREFVEFVVKAVKWAQREAEKQRLLYTDDPVNRDWRRLNNFGLYENSEGDLGSALDWEFDGKRLDREVFVVSRYPSSSAATPGKEIAMVNVKEHIIGTGVEVSFQLYEADYVHYRFAQGLISREEAEAALGEPLDQLALKRMEKLARLAAG
jgi:hypothetical protein